MRFRCEHPIAMSADAFWATIHSEPYEARVAEALGLVTYRTVARDEDADRVHRRIEVRGHLSESLSALLGRIGVSPDARYEEEQWRSKRERRVRFRLHPPVLADRVRVEGEVRVEPRGRDRCLRILEGEARVRIPLLGGRIERLLAGTAEEAYAKAARVANEMSEEAQ